MGARFSYSLITKKTFKDPVILYAGRLTGQKAPQAFIEIAEKMLAKRKNIRFVIAGDGPMKNNLIETAAHKGIGDHIHFTGFLDRHELSKIYAESSIFCMPSISEPFGLSTVEAALAGLPVVVSKNTGAVEVLPEALTVDTGNVDGFVSCIFSTIDNTHKVDIEKIVSENKRAATELTWEKTATQITSIFQSLRLK